MERCRTKACEREICQENQMENPWLVLAPFLSHIFLREKASLWLKAVLFPDYMRREHKTAKVSLLIRIACQTAVDADLIWSDITKTASVHLSHLCRKHTYLWPSKDLENADRGQSIIHRHNVNMQYIFNTGPSQ